MAAAVGSTERGEEEAAAVAAVAVREDMGRKKWRTGVVPVHMVTRAEVARWMALDGDSSQRHTPSQ
jgi:hypothetical protein